MNTSCSHGRFLEKTSFMLIISRCPCKTSRENKKERQKAFPVHTCLPWPHHLFPKPWRTSILARSTDSRQTDGRQTQWSTKVTFFSVLWSDNSLRTAIVRGGEASALDQSDKRKNITEVGYCAAVMRKIRNISDVFYFGERSISVCANTMLSSFALSAIYPSVLLSIYTDHVHIICLWHDLCRIGGGCEVTGAENIKEMWSDDIFVFAGTLISFIYLHITLLCGRI